MEFVGKTCDGRLRTSELLQNAASGGLSARRTRHRGQLCNTKPYGLVSSVLCDSMQGVVEYPLSWRMLVSPCAKFLTMILSLMDQYPEQLNHLFQALADPTRRAVLGRLGKGPASISELAKPFDMALPSFMKHIHFLEHSGWIQTRKEGRVRTCVIEKKAFAAADAWLAEQRAFWDARLDRLDALLEATKDD